MRASTVTSSPSYSPATCCCPRRGGRRCCVSVERQWARGRKLEGEFYDRYKDVRERLHNVLTLKNPHFPAAPASCCGSSTQKLLDRFIFAFFCEDMGERLLFPPQMIRDFMRNRQQ